MCLANSCCDNSSIKFSIIKINGTSSNLNWFPEFIFSSYVNKDRCSGICKHDLISNSNGPRLLFTRVQLCHQYWNIKFGFISLLSIPVRTLPLPILVVRIASKLQNKKEAMAEWSQNLIFIFNNICLTTYASFIFCPKIKSSTEQTPFLRKNVIIFIVSKT